MKSKKEIKGMKYATIVLRVPMIRYADFLQHLKKFGMKIDKESCTNLDDANMAESLTKDDETLQ